jgi:hypothetical protein
MIISDADLLRFTAKIDYTDSCWLWTGNLNNFGYAKFWLNGRKVYVHRLALELHLGRPLQPGMHAAHAAHAICGNRHCCNPAHLREATCAENHADKIADGTMNHGERQGNSKLTDVHVLAIRADTRTQRAIAADYGIHQTAVSLIKKGKAWKHLL